MISYALYARMNDSELYQIARSAGLSVLPSTPREALIKYIDDEEVPPPVAHDVDEWRMAIMRFVIEHRKQLEVQLRCPAKSMDPRACFQCVDEQVHSCLLDNRQNIELIQIHKKPILQPEGDAMATTGEPVMNITNAPRDRDKILARGPFQMSKLARDLNLLEAEDIKLAWIELEKEGRADMLLKALLEYDEKHKGGQPEKQTDAAASHGPGTNGTNGVTADKPGTSVPTVDPNAFKNAQDATAPGIQRQPKVTKAEAPNDNDLGALISSVQALVNSGANQATTIALGLSELRTAVDGNHRGLTVKIDQLAMTILEAMNKQTALLTYTLMTVLTIAEERGIAGRLDILNEAVEQAPTLGPMLKKISAAGKAA